MSLQLLICFLRISAKGKNKNRKSLEIIIWKLQQKKKSFFSEWGYEITAAVKTKLN